jgi:cysteine-rich repeat protein
VGGSATSRDFCTENCGDSVDLGFYECDDGNNIDGDGCSATCTIETGFVCMGGNNDISDKCNEICGDAIRIKTTTGVVGGGCDDGNSLDYDGCSKLCAIEAGWICAGGSPTSLDVCTEICGDGKHMGKDACDDGNLVNGDGCDSTCKLEHGYNCTGGTRYAADTCAEICGDTFQIIDQCDDGNIFSGDGCSSTCMIETGWLCFGGTTLTRSICRLRPQPSIINMTIADTDTPATKMVTVTFNETVLLGSAWNASDLYV